MGLTDNIRGARQFCNVRAARSPEIFATIPNHHYLPMILDSFALHAWYNLNPQIILDDLRKQVLNRVPSLANGSELLCWDNQVSNFFNPSDSKNSSPKPLPKKQKHHGVCLPAMLRVFLCYRHQIKIVS